MGSITSHRWSNRSRPSTSSSNDRRGRGGAKEGGGRAVWILGRILGCEAQTRSCLCAGSQMVAEAITSFFHFTRVTFGDSRCVWGVIVYTILLAFPSIFFSFFVFCFFVYCHCDRVMFEGGLWRFILYRILMVYRHHQKRKEKKKGVLDERRAEWGEEAAARSGIFFPCSLIISQSGQLEAVGGDGRESEGLGHCIEMSKQLC